MLADTGAPAVRYGFDEGNDLVVTVDDLGPAGAVGRIRDASGAEAAVRLQVDGPHNLLNAAAAIGVAGLVGVPLDDAAAAVSAFAGVHRRFEHRGRARGADFYDDYGHTPTEMAVTIDTARRRDPGRLVALVQPHRYSRVQALWRELGASVAGADLVLVTDVYGAAQEPIPGVTGRLVADGVELASPTTPVVYLPHRTEVIDYLEREVRPGDLIVTMGCGDVWMLGDAALERLGGERMSDLARAESILRAACGDRVRTSFSMAPITSFRIGGPAAIYLEPESEADLAAAAGAIAAADLPYVVIGKGSNVLVSDRGFPGLVLQLGRGYRWAARDGDLLTAGGAMPLPAFAGRRAAPLPRRAGVRRGDPRLGGGRGEDERGRARRGDGRRHRRRRGLPARPVAHRTHPRRRRGLLLPPVVAARRFGRHGGDRRAAAG